MRKNNSVGTDHMGSYHNKNVYSLKSIPILLPAGIGAILLFSVLLIDRNFSSERSIDIFALSIVGLLVAFSGALIIIRREAPRPGMEPIKGWGAILTGILAILTFGISGLYLLIELIIRLFF